MPEKAQEHLTNANIYARNASTAWGSAKELYNYVKDQADRLSHWKGIMSTAPVLAMNAAFIPVCVAEYYFSKEIYRDINQDAPWSIAAGFISIGIVISEMLVYFAFKQKQNLKLYELKRYDKKTNDKTPESELLKEVKGYSRQMFLIGLVLCVGIITLLYYFSNERVTRELEGGIRTSKFGIQDFMPIGLYFFEIITGSFVWYTLRKTTLYFQIALKKKSLKNQKVVYSEMTENAKKKYQDAIEDGFKWYENVDSIDNEINEAFYMSTERTDSDDESLFVEPIKREFEATFKIVKENIPFNCEVNLLTEYKYHRSFGKNDKDTGEIKIKFSSFPSDAIVNLRLTGFDSAKNEIIIKDDIKRYELDGSVYTIDWG